LKELCSKFHNFPGLAKVPSSKCFHVVIGALATGTGAEAVSEFLSNTLDVVIETVCALSNR
jgi:hypothetical protein